MSNYMVGLVIVIIGATVGMVLAYFSIGSIGSGAVFGGLIGLYFAIATALPTVSPFSNDPDLNE